MGFSTAIERPAACLPVLVAAVLAMACKKSDPPSPGDAAATSSASVVAEPLPRCRADAARLTLPGEDILLGDAALSGDALFVGVLRREGKGRVASVLRAPLDLASLRVVDLGPANGDDPAPTVRWFGGSPFVAVATRKAAVTGLSNAVRELRVARIEDDSADPPPLTAVGKVVQQADESPSFDVARSEGALLVAWDEDAPILPGRFLADRGVVMVEALTAGAKPRVASPATSDAEAPRLLARPGGYWLAWLARRAETVDAGWALESPAEDRAYRWVELVALDSNGDPVSPVRRVSSEKGRVSSFALAPAPSGGQGNVTVLVVDENAGREGAGARIVRFVIEGDRSEHTDLVDGGVASSEADLLTTLPADDARRWLAWSDTGEHTHLVPLGPLLAPTGQEAVEPALQGARLIAATPGAIYAAVPTVASPDGPNGGPHGSPHGSSDAGRFELRRFACP